MKNKTTKIYFIDGNHEDHDSLRELRQNSKENSPIEIEKNLFYIPRGTIITVKNKKVFCMGGAFSIDWKLRREHIDWFQDEVISSEDIEKLNKEEKIDWVFSHTCPSNIVPSMIVDNKICYEDPSNTMLQKVYDMYHPEKWFFGHWHRYMHTKIEKTNFYGLDLLGGSTIYFIKL